MIKDVLQSINNVELYPIVSMALFLIAFLMVIMYMIRLDKKEIERYSRFPLEDSDRIKPATIPVSDEDINGGVR